MTIEKYIRNPMLQIIGLGAAGNKPVSGYARTNEDWIKHYRNCLWLGSRVSTMRVSDAAILGWFIISGSKQIAHNAYEQKASSLSGRHSLDNVTRELRTLQLGYSTRRQWSNDVGQVWNERFTWHVKIKVTRLSMQTAKTIRLHRSWYDAYADYCITDARLNLVKAW